MWGDPNVIADLAEDTTPDIANDFVETYDTSAGAHKKVKLANLPTGSGRQRSSQRGECHRRQPD